MERIANIDGIITIKHIPRRLKEFSLLHCASVKTTATESCSINFPHEVYSSTVELINEVQFEMKSLKLSGSFDVLALIVIIEFTIEMHPLTFMEGIVPSITLKPKFV